MKANETLPIDPEGRSGDQTRIVVASSWTDPRTGQTFVHKDLVPTATDWAREEHIGPTHLVERFGDVESWATYVLAYDRGLSLYTWNSQGLRAVLDYPTAKGAPGLREWLAVHPFKLSAAVRDWTAFASGAAMSQKQAIEKLEDLAEDIIDPASADLTKLLRDLRANASAQAETELRPDGTSTVSFKRDTAVRGGAAGTELPSLLRIAIPVLVGLTERFELRVRMRVSVDEAARLLFRFSLVNADRVLETVYAERVAAAQALLGESRVLLRADG